MSVEAPSAPTFSGTAPSAPSLEVGGGGFASLGGEAAPVSDFHSLSGEIFSSDRALSQPKSIFQEGLFEPVVKVDSPSVSEAWGEVKAGPKVDVGNRSLFELFGPQLDVVKAPTVEGPVSAKDFSTLAVEESFPRQKASPQGEKIGSQRALFELFGPPLEAVKIPFEDKPLAQPEKIFDREAFTPITQSETAQKVSEKAVFETPKVIPKKQILWEVAQEKIIFTGSDESEEEEEKVVQIKTEKKLLKEKVEQQAEEAQTLVQTQTEDSLEEESGGKGEISGVISERPKVPEEPKEPLWEVGGKKAGEEETDQIVLLRRLQVGQGVLEEANKEASQKGQLDKYWLVSQVAVRLPRIDIPTAREILRIIFGGLTFPAVAREAKKEIGRLRQDEIEPKKIFRTLSEALVRKPPLRSQQGEMEYDGSLPQSQLEKVGEKAASLAQEGAKHIVYDPQKGEWKKVEQKPSRYPLELDRTRKIVPALAVDREKSLWYTHFSERAQARAKRKAKSQ